MCKEARPSKVQKIVEGITVVAETQKVDQGMNCGQGEWMGRVKQFRREAKKLLAGNHNKDVMEQLPPMIAHLLT